ALDFLKTAKGTIRENAPEPVKTAAIYSPEDELECIAELIAKGAYKAALERALKGAKVKGSSWLFHFLSARANLKTKNDQNALPLLEKACKLNRSFFPWEKDFNDLICKLTKNGMSEELRSQIISYKPKFFV
ncbi:MAG: hypothetical protein JNL74_04640, partial [Fibrobacteres bacterium]|nr:hypothetical protein [Fibrobacterota bacterium]